MGKVFFLTPPRKNRVKLEIPSIDIKDYRYKEIEVWVYDMFIKILILDSTMRRI